MRWNDHVRDWVAQLRSNAQQTTGVMKRIISDDSEPIHAYCCLGLASELAGCEFKTPAGYNKRTFGVVEDGGLPSMANMPGWLMQLLTLDYGDVRMLTSMNDGTWNVPRLDFKLIADVIVVAARGEMSIDDAYDLLYKFRN